MNKNIPILDGPLITKVTLVDKITRPLPGHFHSESLPGHLIHLVETGRVIQEAGGITEKFGPGDSIWFYENEPVKGRIIESPWTFFTICFNAPTLLPPPLDQRVKPISSTALELGEQLLDVWQDTSSAPTIRHMRVHALLLELLVHIVSKQTQTHRLDAASELWWSIERQIRQDLSQPLDLDYLATLCRRSKRSINRVCYLATSTSPMKRIKEVRLGYARGLVQHSKYNITEIAFRVGYNRVQEFSRDYHKRYGKTPTEDRQSAPQYKQRKT